MEQATENEKKVQKRKDRIKNVLIVFLVVMPLLTFFSGTIQNWSLPEVATAYVQSGTISPQIRASGTVEADDPYNIVLTETRKIASVAVRVGDEVKKDDVIYYLEDAESTELEEAEKRLRTAELDFELTLFGENVTDATILRASNGQVASISEYRTRLADVNARLLAAEEADKSVQARIDALTLDYNRRIASLGEADTSAQQYSNAEAEAEVARLNNERTAQEAIVTAKQAEMTANMVEDPLGSGNFRPPSDTDPAEATQHAAYTAAETARNDAQSQINNINARISELNNRIANNTRDASQITTQTAQQKAQIEQEYTLAKLALDTEKAQTAAALEEVTAERAELLGSISNEITLYNKLQEVEDARREVDRLRERTTGATVNAPVEGTVTSLAYVAGQSTKPDETAAVIQVAGKAMTMSVSVTAEQAKSLKTGDMVDPQNAWAYSSFKAQISSIRPDPQDPAGKRIVTITIDTPEVQAGQTVNIRMGEGQRNYEMTIPNSAIREDNNGKFILIINERSSPLRNRYIAQRVDVDVVAQDDTTSAITAALEGYEYVITTASAPIRSGQEVRLANTGY